MQGAVVCVAWVVLVLAFATDVSANVSTYRDPERPPRKANNVSEVVYSGYSEVVKVRRNLIWTTNNERSTHFYHMWETFCDIVNFGHITFS